MALNRLMQRLCWISSFLLVLTTISSEKAEAQILDMDQLTLHNDSIHQRQLYGNIKAGLDLNESQTHVLHFTSSSSASYFMKRDVLMLLAQYGLTRTGKTNVWDAGYTHLRYRMDYNKKISPEFYAQYQYDGVLGMKSRWLTGSNLRFALKRDSLTLIYLSGGIFYERERWDRGVVNTPINPAGSQYIQRNKIKINTSFKFTRRITENSDFVFINYLQFVPDKDIIYPRIAPSMQLDIQMSKHLQFQVAFDGLYDFRPVIPIDHFYYSITNQLVFNL